MPRKPSPTPDEPAPTPVFDADEHTLDAPEPLAPARELRTAEPKKKLSRSTAQKAAAQSLRAAHHIGAKLWEEPAIELADDEALALAAAGLDLLDAYGYKLETRPKVAAWVQLVSVAADIEGPRVILLVTRPPRKRDAEQPPGPPPA